MAPTPAPDQDFQHFSAPTPDPELVIFPLWLRLLLF